MAIFAVTDTVLQNNTVAQQCACPVLHYAIICSAVIIAIVEFRSMPVSNLLN